MMVHHNGSSNLAATPEFVMTSHHCLSAFFSLSYVCCWVNIFSFRKAFIFRHAFFLYSFGLRLVVLYACKPLGLEYSLIIAAVPASQQIFYYRNFLWAERNRPNYRKKLNTLISACILLIP